MNWNEIIVKLRNEMLLTQTEFANLLGVSFATVNRWENNRFEPSMKVKRKIKELCEKNGIQLGGNKNG